jgi:hypothetical protein
MAETSGFFPDVSGDREYTSDWLAKYIASFIGNGVYNGELAVTADGSAMSVTLPSGRAWINGYHYRNDGDMTLTIDNADGVLNRVDIVVLRWDVNARSITAQVIKGTPASTAAAPAITRTVEQYDLKLAEISIPAGTTAISQALITDCRLDNSVCGIVTGVLDQVDTTTFYSQIQADLAAFKSGSEADFSTWSEQQKASFDSWFNGIKDILGADEAGNLLNLINDHKADTVSHVTQAEHDSIASAVQGATIDGEEVPKNNGILDFPMPTAAQMGVVALDAPVITDVHSISEGGFYRSYSGSNQPVSGTSFVYFAIREGWKIVVVAYKLSQEVDMWVCRRDSSDGVVFTWTNWTRINTNNVIIIPNTDSVPTGLANGTVVLRYEP